MMFGTSRAWAVFPSVARFSDRFQRETEGKALKLGVLRDSFLFFASQLLYCEQVPLLLNGTEGERHWQTQCISLQGESVSACRCGFKRTPLNGMAILRHFNLDLRTHQCPARLVQVEGAQSFLRFKSKSDHGFLGYQFLQTSKNGREAWQVRRKVERNCWATDCTRERARARANQNSTRSMCSTSRRHMQHSHIARATHTHTHTHERTRTQTRAHAHAQAPVLDLLGSGWLFLGFGFRAQAWHEEPSAETAEVLVDMSATAPSTPGGYCLCLVTKS